MAELVPGSPWSEVVHIEDRAANARSSRYWVLTLACGHIAVRRQSQLKMSHVGSAHRIGFAPQRVRCYTCGGREMRGAGA
jgi:hypothetical protein